MPRPVVIRLRDLRAASRATRTAARSRAAPCSPATAGPASTAARARTSPSTTSSRAPRAAPRPGRTSSPRARRATGARATTCPPRPTCTRAGSRARRSPHVFIHVASPTIPAAWRQWLPARAPGRRGLSGLARPSRRLAAPAAGRGRRARRRDAVREPVAGQPSARPRRRARARAAPLVAPGLGGPRPDLDRRPRGARARAAGRHGGAGARAARPIPTRRARRRRALITRVPGAAFHGRPPVGPLSAPWRTIHAVDPPASRATGATTSPSASPCRPGRERPRVGSARSRGLPAADPLERHPPRLRPATRCGGRGAHGVVDWTTLARRRVTLGTCAGTWPRPAARADAAPGRARPDYDASPRDVTPELDASTQQSCAPGARGAASTSASGPDDEGRDSGPPSHEPDWIKDRHAEHCAGGPIPACRSGGGPVWIPLVRLQPSDLAAGHLQGPARTRLPIRTTSFLW